MFAETSKELNEKDIREIERKLNIVLPKQLVCHYMKYNGGIPEKRFLHSRISDIETSVHTFFPMKYKNEVGFTVEDLYLHFTGKNVIPKKYLPFACDAGSNMFCINMENEKVKKVEKYSLDSKNNSILVKGLSLSELESLRG